MSEFENIQKNILLARHELKNIRQEVLKLKAKQKQEIEGINHLLFKKDYKEEKEKDMKVLDQNIDHFNMVPIGFITSCFKNKNGIPRQPSLCQTSKASLEISKTYFTNPEHSLIGLSEFPYIWILFVFHKNTECSIKAKVHPPRLNGTSIGVFSTRSPHRPCAIGLSLTKIEKITGNTIFLSGVDMLDGTPVLDIKPYIPSYDIPTLYRNAGYFHDETPPALEVHKGNSYEAMNVCFNKCKILSIQIAIRSENSSCAKMRKNIFFIIKNKISGIYKRSNQCKIKSQ